MKAKRGHQDRPQPRARRASTAASPARRARLLLGLRGRTRRSGWRSCRQADQHHEADLREDVVVHARAVPHADSAASRHIGTTRMTASGSGQLSYCAASTRKTNTTAKREDDRRGVAGDASPGRRARSTRSRSPAAASRAPAAPSSRAPGRWRCPARRAVDLGRGIQVVARHAVRAGGRRGRSRPSRAAPSRPRSTRVRSLAMSSTVSAERRVGLAVTCQVRPSRLKSLT